MPRRRFVVAMKKPDPIADRCQGWRRLSWRPGLLGDRQLPDLDLIQPVIVGLVRMDRAFVRRRDAEVDLAVCDAQDGEVARSLMTSSSPACG